MNASAQYDLPLTEQLELSTRADYSYVGDYFFSRDNIAAQQIPGRTLVNGQVGLRDSKGMWEVYLFARNLFNKKYLVAKGSGGFAFRLVGTNLQESYGARGSWGVRAASISEHTTVPSEQIGV